MLCVSQSPAGREPSLTGFNGLSREHKDVYQRLIGSLRESFGRTILVCFERGGALENSGTRQGRMETLLVPAQTTRRSPATSGTAAFRSGYIYSEDEIISEKSPTLTAS
ncbi:unnamed protein product [Heligmosomoides polygyrus]|uniref:SLC12 domain-containing protein n=1 Tax=Heligmosomoides polygyrus TaxID=6339 RepID=A0A183G9C6_HELPZ|nr:unnamed protein product [Heligmosomoides polygyrus]